LRFFPFLISVGARAARGKKAAAVEKSVIKIAYATHAERKENFFQLESSLGVPRGGSGGCSTRCVRLRGEMKKPCEGVEEGERERERGRKRFEIENRYRERKAR
jgi:hypothetical protein